MQTRWSNLGDLADRSLDQDRAAVIDLRDPDRPRTYSHHAIDEMAMGVARQLTEASFARGTRIGILSLNRAEYLAAYFGIMRAGLVAVPVNTKLPREAIDYILNDASIALCFADAEKRPMVSAGIPVIGFDNSGPEGFANRCPPAAFETLTVGPNEIGQILYTSGSSGRPKGVPLTHGGQLWALSLFDGPRSDRHLVAQPLFHMNGLVSSKVAFATNASLVLMPGFEPRRYSRALAEWRVTTAAALPTMFARVIKEEALLAELDFSALRRIRLGSAPMTLALFQRIRATFPNAVVAHGYASTEAGPGALGRHPDGLPTPPLSVGHPVPGVEVRLVDGPSEDEGVLMLRTPALMSGYNNLPEESARVLRGGWYYSGDMMRRDAQGFYHFAGRADDIVRLLRREHLPRRGGEAAGAAPDDPAGGGGAPAGRGAVAGPSRIRGAAAGRDDDDRSGEAPRARGWPRLPASAPRGVPRRPAMGRHQQGGPKGADRPRLAARGGRRVVAMTLLEKSALALPFGASQAGVAKCRPPGARQSAHSATRGEYR
jgi:acyl-CoA synthetase (AMP-forming)/AMP-acid ligase II